MEIISLCVAKLLSIQYSRTIHPRAIHWPWLTLVWLACVLGGEGGPVEIHYLNVKPT